MAQDKPLYLGLHIDKSISDNLNKVAPTIKKNSGRLGNRSDAVRLLLRLGYAAWQSKKSNESLRDSNLTTP